MCACTQFLTPIVNSDDFWPYSIMRQIANRMQIFSVKDLEPLEAFKALKKLRQESIGRDELESDQVLARAAKASDCDDDVEEEVCKISINFVHHQVQLDSMLTLEAAREVVDDPEFEPMLKGVIARVDELESLGRTRELTFKDVKPGDRIKVVIDKTGGAD
ncbi:unnamed protein product [Rhizoctonia solani]|uniref:AAA protein C-terminal winged helix domain-containing protein n=1 Tax=Rhizoctonia solani TaxID=456999 RepID=A0A8H3BG95_9AGAM|nr:unnamed protein product [Rhizoctonia solani]